MEVDDAARLVLSDLDEPDLDELAELLAGDAAEAGQLARQVGVEAAATASPATALNSTAAR